MAYTLQQLSDIEDIKILKHRYFRAFDTADAAMLETLFTDDLTVDFRSNTYSIKISGKADMLRFLANSFHSGTVAMHHGNMPEIELTGDDAANGTWSLFDIYINSETGLQVVGSAIYKDRYRREDGVWKIAHTEYDRIMELTGPFAPSTSVAVAFLANAGLKPNEREDITDLMSWASAT